MAGIGAALTKTRRSLARSFRSRGSDAGRLLVIVGQAGCIIVLLTGGSCSLPHATLPPPYLAGDPAPAALPPYDGIVTWLEGEQGSLTADPAGNVTAWRDGRHPGRSLVPVDGRTGRLVTATLPTPNGPQTVSGLSCGPTPRCAYTLQDPSVASFDNALDHRAYMIFAVVRASLGRRDNYFVMTQGRGCNVGAGGTGCASNSALHLGFNDGHTLRHGRYDNDVDLGSLLPHEYGRPPLWLIVAGYDADGVSVAYLTARQRRGTLVQGRGPLDGHGALMIGGTRFPVMSSPDWHFEGEIFAMLIYDRALSDAEAKRVVDYLRNRYGPR